MFEDKELVINRPETKLLYDIRQLLIEQNELLKSVLSPIKQAVDTEAPKPENNAHSEKIKCKYCGGEHDNMGQFMACAKKHKKESAK